MLGYVLSDDYWGRGLMTEAARRVVRHTFEDEGLDVLACGHFPFNARSRRVIEKCGFKLDGVLRQAYEIFDGRIYDEWVYSILREEYFRDNK